MLDLRFLVGTACALVLIVVLASAGWFVAELLVAPICAWVGIGQVVLSDVSDATAYRLSIAAAFALPVCVGWLAALVHRVVARAHPSRARLAVFVGVPFFAAAIGFAKNVLFLKIAIAEVSGQTFGMFSLTGLELGWAPIRWTLGCGVVLCVAAGVLARRGAPLNLGVLLLVSALGAGGCSQRAPTNEHTPRANAATTRTQGFHCVPLEPEPGRVTALCKRTVNECQAAREGERAAGAIAGVCRHQPEAHCVSYEFVENGEARIHHMCMGNATGCEAIRTQATREGFAHIGTCAIER